MGIWMEIDSYLLLLAQYCSDFPAGALGYS